MGGFAPRRRLGAGLVLLAMSVAGLQAPAADAAPTKASGYRVVTLPLDAVALTEKGLVAGNVGGEVEPRAATWQHGKLRVLPLPAGATWSRATDANVHGVVVGEVFVPRSGVHAVLWVHGRPRLLPEPEPFWEDEDTESLVDAINDNGDVVGATDTGFGFRITWWLDAVDDPTPRMTGSGRGTATDLTDNGMTVGGGEASWRAVRWSSPGAPPRELQELGPGEVVSTYASSVNESGQVVGTEYTWDADQETFVWKSLLWDADGIPSWIPQPADGGTATASLINDRGLVVGSYLPPGGGAPEVAVWAGSSVRRTGVSGSPLDLTDKGAMLVRDGSRSLVVTPWGARSVRGVKPVIVPRRPSSAHRGAPFAQGLRVVREQACLTRPSPLPCPWSQPIS